MALTHRVTEAEARYALRKRVAEPPTLSLGWMDLSDGGRSFAGPVFGVAWPLPVFDRNQGRRQVASAEVIRAQFDLVAAIRRAQQEANGALASYSELHELALRGPLAAEEGVVEAVFAAFEAGEATLTDVLDTWRATVDVQMARLETMARALSAERELEAALGRPISAGGKS
jgi:cobalt-zinc-cadmium efflux system outer membrane protein